MNTTQTDELAKLLQITPDDVDGLLETLEVQLSPIAGCKPIPISFYYVRYQDSIPRYKHLIDKLCDCVIPYCLDRRKYESLTPMKIRPLYREAKRLFAKPKGGKTGEPGEVLAYFLLEGKFSAVKIVSKMSLKTSPDMHVHGADGVHLRFEGGVASLYYAESKLHSTYKAGVRDTIGTVKRSLSELASDTDTYEDFEVKLVSDHLDLPDGELRKQVENILNPYTKDRSNLSKVHACFVGFDVTELAQRCPEPDFVSIYKLHAVDCYEYVHRAIEADAELAEERWLFVFIPFDSVATFRDLFLKGLAI